jgi:hypothetical protein
MMNEPDTEKENSGDPAPEEAPEKEQAPAWEDELDSYPLREKSDDPRWAVRTVWIWAGFVMAALLFILTLLVLGALYD